MNKRPISEQTLFANMHNQTLEEILNGEKMSKIRLGFKENKPHLVCKTCINNPEQHIA